MKPSINTERNDRKASDRNASKSFAFFRTKVSLFLLQKCCYFCLFFAGDMVYTNQDLDDYGAVFTHIENT